MTHDKRRSPMKTLALGLVVAMGLGTIVGSNGRRPPPPPPPYDDPYGPQPYAPDPYWDGQQPPPPHRPKPRPDWDDGRWGKQSSAARRLSSAARPGAGDRISPAIRGVDRGSLVDVRGRAADRDNLGNRANLARRRVDNPVCNPVDSLADSRVLPAVDVRGRAAGRDNLGNRANLARRLADNPVCNPVDSLADSLADSRVLPVVVRDKVADRASLVHRRADSRACSRVVEVGSLADSRPDSHSNQDNPRSRGGNNSSSRASRPSRDSLGSLGSLDSPRIPDASRLTAGGGRHPRT